MARPLSAHDLPAAVRKKLRKGVKSSATDQRSFDQPARSGLSVTSPSTVSITLPWAVIVPDNAKHAAVNGRLILTSRYRKAKAEAVKLAAEACNGVCLAHPHLTVRVTVYPPNEQRRDIANILKLCCDALTGSAYDDDQQISHLEVFRGWTDKANPRVEITVSKALVISFRPEDEGRAIKGRETKNG